jgi:hypothetical protein
MSVRRGTRAHGAEVEERTRDEAVMEVMTRTRCSGEDEGRGVSDVRAGRPLAGETRRARARGAGDEGRA